MSKARCLLIDDSEDIHLIIKKSLTEMCEVFSSLSFADAKKQFESKHFDIIIIDLMLDGNNGMDLLKEFKSNGSLNKDTRFFIMTGKDSTVDEALGHSLGVDEYLKKPVDQEVLKAIFRKNLKLLRQEAGEIINEPPFYIIPANHQVFIGPESSREEVILTIKEFKLLCKLISMPEKTFTREDLFAQVWDNDSNSTYRTIDMHVSSLRKKLKEYGSHIKTVHQVGYKFSKS